MYYSSLNKHNANELSVKLVSFVRQVLDLDFDT